MSKVVKMDGTVIDQPPPQEDEDIKDILEQVDGINKDGRVLAIAVMAITTAGFLPLWSSSGVTNRSLSLLGGVKLLSDLITDHIWQTSRDVDIDSEPEEPA